MLDVSVVDWLVNIKKENVGLFVIDEPFLSEVKKTSTIDKNE
jgi:hypothetical protein